MAEKLIELNSVETALEIFGSRDENIRLLENEFSITAVCRGSQIKFTGEPEQVAAGIELAHLETSHLQYNDENALSYTISLALYAARNFYTVIREMPSGKGFADMVYLPKKRFPEKPALVVELKWDKSAQGAIRQIREKKYCQSLTEYQGKLLLIGINYDKKTRVHSCEIEEWEK